MEYPLVICGIKVYGEEVEEWENIHHQKRKKKEQIIYEDLEYQARFEEL